MTGKMHGSAINKEQDVQGKFCIKSNIYVFVMHEDAYYKMTAVSLKDANASSTPTTMDKFIAAASDGIKTDATTETVCDMWEGNGFRTKSGDGWYNLKEVVVTGCGECLHI